VRDQRANIAVFGDLIPNRVEELNNYSEEMTRFFSTVSRGCAMRKPNGSELDSARCHQEHSGFIE
jgi:hypothetical protein